MNDLIPLDSDSFSASTPKGKQKYSFWRSPGGKLGSVASWGILAGIGYGLYKILPFVVSLLQNAISAAILGVILFALVYVIMDKQAHAIVWNLYKMVVNRIATTVIEYDPVSIANNYIAYLKQRKQLMVQRLGTLKGAIEKLSQDIGQSDQERIESLDIVKRAKGDSDLQHQSAAALHSRRAGRRMKSIQDFTKIKQKLEMLYRVLTKLKLAAEFTIEDKEDEVKMVSRQREAIMAGYSAYQAAVEIINGDPDKRAMFDQSMQFMLDDMAARIGEIDSFLDMSEGFLGAIDLQNMAYDESAMRQLEAWEKQLDDTLLLPAADKQLLLAASQDPGQPLTFEGEDRVPVPATAPKDTTTRFGKLFEED